MYRIPPADRKLTEAALAAAARGWPIFPVIPGDKRPAIPGHDAEHCPRTRACANGHRTPEQRATADPDRIKKCWGSGAYNIGIATGPSGLLVIDLDVADDGQRPPDEWAQPGITCGEDVLVALAERAGAALAELLDTYTVRTRSGGSHLYYLAPAGIELRNTAGKNGGGLGWKIDTRAWGGYVVGAGSIVDGKPYALVYDRAPAPLPQWIVDRLKPPALPMWTSVAALDVLRRGAHRRSRYANAVLRDEVQLVLDAVEGTRHDTLMRASRRLGRRVAGGLLPEDLVREALMVAGTTVGLPASECARTIAWGIRAGAASPAGGVA